MSPFLFELAIGCAVCGLLLSIANLVADFMAWKRKRKKEKDDA